MTIEKITQEEFDKLVLEICYDRHLCELAGADYSRLNEQDIRYIKNYIMERYEVEKK